MEARSRAMILQPHFGYTSATGSRYLRRILPCVHIEPETERRIWYYSLIPPTDISILQTSVRRRFLALAAVGGSRTHLNQRCMQRRSRRNGPHGLAPWPTKGANDHGSTGTLPERATSGFLRIVNRFLRCTGPRQAMNGLLVCPSGCRSCLGRISALPQVGCGDQMMVALGR